MSTILKKDDFSYSFDFSACATCQGRCCTGASGNIYVTEREIGKIAELLALGMSDFVERYLLKKGYRYTVKERKIGESYECVFFDRESSGCTIYDARPLQCETFPFWEYYKNRIGELKKECPGIVEE